MADNTPIEWTDATWNPITGCSVVSPGCTNCYAMKLAGGRLRHHPTRAGLTQASKAGPVWTGEVRFNPEVLDQPLRWRRARRIFVCAHGDLFHESVPDAWIDQVFAVMALAPQHTFQVLTKRAARMQAYMNDPTTSRRAWARAWTIFKHSVGGRYAGDHWPLDNVWLGVSAEDQPRADERIPKLLGTLAAMRFASLEPTLGAVDLHKLEVRGGRLVVFQSALTGALTALHDAADSHLDFTGPRRLTLDSVIVGGESGPGARPMHPNWARKIRDDCAAAGVPFHFKQWGAWEPNDTAHAMDGGPVPGSTRRFDCVTFPNAQKMNRVGKKAAGRLLDGVEHNGGPW